MRARDSLSFLLAWESMLFPLDEILVGPLSVMVRSVNAERSKLAKKEPLVPESRIAYLLEY